jgi:hypothetical protein
VEITGDIDDRVNGVVFDVDDDGLGCLDEREAGYERLELPPGTLEPYTASDDNRDCDSTFPEGRRVWMYVPKPADVFLPSKHFPVLQSYVDVMLAGALEDYGEAFARDIVRTTSGWEPAKNRLRGIDSMGWWLDDRARPAYVRASSGAMAKRAEVDAMLEQELGWAVFSRRCVVGATVLHLQTNPNLSRRY